MSALAALVLVASAGLGLWLTLPIPSGAQPGLSELRSQADRQRGRERSLESGVARLSALVRRVESQLAIVERRRAQVQAELDSDQAKLDRLQSELREQRIRLTRLRARLAEARMILSGRLVALYKAPQPDLVSIVLESQGWGDLVERTAFQKRIRRQDNRIILTVRRARREAGSAVKRLTRDEARQQRVTEAVQARRDAVASISQAIAGRRAVLVEARAAALGGAELRARRPPRRRAAHHEARGRAGALHQRARPRRAVGDPVADRPVRVRRAELPAQLGRRVGLLPDHPGHLEGLRR